jgi:hypothetical protein
VKIEVLYVSDCPNHPPTVERVKQVLAAEGVRVPVHEVLVRNETDARALQFLGSPSVRVNGQDVEPVEDASPRLSCRLYANLTGVPGQDSLRRAIAGAKESDGKNL